MRRLPSFAVVSILLGLAGCGGWLPPFETVPDAAAGQSEATRVAVCYNWLTASKDRVRDVATIACGPGATAERIGRDVTLDYCPILTPARATFSCTAP